VFPFCTAEHGLCSVINASNAPVLQFYSNSDLMTFLSLSGLPNATIPDSNVYGDLANDQSNPGGEAQLDVEYIMVRTVLSALLTVLQGARGPYYSLSKSSLQHTITHSLPLLSCSPLLCRPWRPTPPPTSTPSAT
jgi:hypothetical protein